MNNPGKTIAIPQDITELLLTLNHGGFEAYLVGGCVRDYLLYKVPKDWDITTSATPDEMQEIFAAYTTIPTGLKHGTITVLTDSHMVEITTYRTEYGYSDHRHPDTVAFTSLLNEDLQRRDFTMNAIAYHPDEGFIDPFGGVEDIRQQRIRCVGNPNQRFDEDALRILRAMRFSAVLGFTIDPLTASAMCSCVSLLDYVSAERIYAELSKMVCGSYFSPVAQEFHDVIFFVIPELLPTYGFQQKNPHHHLDVFTHTLTSMSAISATLPLRFAMLFHDSGKPSAFSLDDQGIGHFYGHASISEEIAQKVLCRLKADNQTIEDVCTLIRYHDTVISPTPVDVKRWLNRLGEVNFERLCEIQKADCLAQSPVYYDRLNNYDTLREIAARILSENQCFRLKDLAISGKDLIAVGFKPGKELGNMLQFLLNEVLEERCPNTETSLLESALSQKPTFLA